MREEILIEKLGALWENQVPKDESHIPWITLMEENLSFNGGTLIYKLGEKSLMVVCRENVEREIFGVGEFRRE